MGDFGLGNVFNGLGNALGGLTTGLGNIAGNIGQGLTGSIFDNSNVTNTVGKNINTPTSEVAPIASTVATPTVDGSAIQSQIRSTPGVTSVDTTNINNITDNDAMGMLTTSNTGYKVPSVSDANNPEIVNQLGSKVDINNGIYKDKSLANNFLGTGMSGLETIGMANQIYNDYRNRAARDATFKNNARMENNRRARSESVGESQSNGRIKKKSGKNLSESI